MSYRYVYGPNHERLDYDGLRELQCAILDLRHDVWALLRGDMRRRFIDELRRRLGL